MLNTYPYYLIGVVNEIGACFQFTYLLTKLNIALLKKQMDILCSHMKLNSKKQNDRRQIQISQLKSPFSVMASAEHGLMNTLLTYRKMNLRLTIL